MDYSGSTLRYNIEPSAQTWCWVGVQFFILGFITLLISFFVEQEEWIYHGAFCLLGGLLSFLRLRRYFDSSFSAFLTDHRLVFLLSFSLYFLFGASMLAFGVDSAISQSMTIMKIGVSQALLVDSMNSMGFGISLIVSGLSKPYWLPRCIQSVTPRFRNLQILKVLFIMFIVGGLARLVVVSNDYSSDAEVISVLWRILDKTLLLFVFVALLYEGKFRRAIQGVAILVGMSLSLIGLLGLSKQEFALPLLAIIGGIAFRTNSRFILLGGCASVYLVLSVVAEPIQYGRSNLDTLLVKLSFTDRIKLIENGFHTLQDIEINERYSIWSRTSYVTAQAAAVNFYDSGNGDDEYLKLPWVFVPRFVYSDKPTIGTESGIELNYKVYGTRTSSLGVGPFVDGYYNLGWFGFIFSSVLVGGIVSQTSAIAKLIYERKLILLYPIMFMGLFVSFRIDGTMAGDYLGIFVVISYVLVVLAITNYLIFGSKR